MIAGANIIRAKRVSNCYIPPKKYVICACVVCSTNLGFSVEKNCTYIPGISRLPRYVYDTRYVLCTRYMCTWYQPATQIRMYLVSAGRRTFRPWTHTSDDSYMYQLSLVVATATTVIPGIFFIIFYFIFHLFRRPFRFSLLSTHLVC